MYTRYALPVRCQSAADILLLSYRNQSSCTNRQDQVLLCQAGPCSLSRIDCPRGPVPMTEAGPCYSIL